MLVVKNPLRKYQRNNMRGGREGILSYYLFCKGGLVEKFSEKGDGC